MNGDTALGWLPDSWHCTSFNRRGGIDFTDRVQVEKFTANPPVTAADFDLDVIKPGMIVSEETVLPGNNPRTAPDRDISVYRAKEGGKREYIPDPFQRKGDTYPARARQKKLMSWSLLVIPVVVGITGLLAWARRRRKAR
jgi:hypothetical protein